MSEELLQTIPQKIGRFTYYKLGHSTLSQLVDHGIIPKKNYGVLKSKKPDGLVTYQGKIKALIEYKQPKALSSQKQIDSAIKQEVEVAKALCKILIVTDGTKSFWINALNGEPIRDQKGQDLRTAFNPLIVRNINTIEFLIEEVDASIDKSNSQIKSAKLIDPSPLANRLWQTIWVATGKSPIKCLYNVVELFIFKFLSDLKVLDEDISFNKIYKKAQDNSADALDFYARNTRHKIYKLFPKGDDGTTIINGTIFVNESGNANLSQAILFQKSLEHLSKYSEEFGSLTKIDKEFKTKLYESFLKQEVEALGQYFTPRILIQSVIRMAGLDEPDFQFQNKRICDPFCGVGGFITEILNMNEKMKDSYKPTSKGKINVPFTLHGFDKGFERDDERTIILAKSNMLIYLAEILFKNPTTTTEFAKSFNSTFKLFKDNLGTFGHIISEENNKYDYILSNPPYVTTGSGIIKEEIAQTPLTKDEYPVNALGLEGISIEWIIKSLRLGGKAFIVIPDGILARVQGKKLRDYILKECYLDAIISLPERTFFANFENTYILAVTKKQDNQERQHYPVFTYLISNIGEKLTSVKREEIEENDLPEMEKLFRIYDSTKGISKELLERESKRCKVWDIDRFYSNHHWVIDRWLTKEEKIEAGLEENIEAAAKHEVDEKTKKLKLLLVEYENASKSENFELDKFMEVALGNEEYFKISIGERVIKKDTLTEGVPVFSANVFEPFGYIEKSNLDIFENNYIIWSIDGNFNFNLIPQKQPFATTDHCGAIEIISNQIIPEFLLFALNQQKQEESFDRSFRASLTNMRLFKVKIPINESGKIDKKKQETIAKRYLKLLENKKEIVSVKKELDDVFERFISI